ncbi:hypothetical protein HDF18_22345 [Mucilaginibacter sp. X5P1]|uniref:hypothetical protein n=1 Tax=Mucilaginibacter sp. X5P1 TaxID=2723088 RepID=UPI00161F1E1A|nr:hypothetical protein [Mucilaginibacter sp. X5P1]MBB6141019.1 hypothetical protein [Mucilaginibacter sp. X5P1]
MVVVLVTSGQPSLNPRLVKEADALSNAGYDVTVLYVYWNDWATKFDAPLLKNKKWKAIRVGGDPDQQKAVYFFSRLIHKISRFVIQKIGPVNSLSQIAITRGAYFLTREAKKHKADLYIGHNLGALAAVIKAAEKHHAKSGFDTEDFHRQEVSNDKSSLHYKNVKYLEDKYLSKADYVTAASPQIAEAYERLYPGIKPVSILNVFPRDTSVEERSVNKGIVKLFWFSQTIGANRGLEEVIEALNLLNSNNFELHLLGNSNDNTQQQLSGKARFDKQQIFFHEPILADDLISFASQFDIGLASENSTPYNRDICLTNKIFTYLQAGLTIVASDTTAQKAFLNEYPEVGKEYQTNNIQSLTTILSGYQADRELLHNTCTASLKLGKEKMNWENESKKFLTMVEKTLN